MVNGQSRGGSHGPGRPLLHSHKKDMVKPCFATATWFFFICATARSYRPFTIEFSVASNGLRQQ